MTVINLRRARKAMQRSEADRQAAANRLKFGRTKEQKQREALQAEEARRRLEQLRRD